jgi:hypothetical protein
LRALLKRALRSHQLRALMVEEDRAGAWVKAGGEAPFEQGGGI